MEYLITSFVEDDFIPDVLVEVFLSNGRDYDYSSSEDENSDQSKRTRKQLKREAHGIYERIEVLAVPDALKIICGDVVAEILDKYLDDEAAKRMNHPLLVIREGLINEVVGEEVRKSCSEGVDEGERGLEESHVMNNKETKRRQRGGQRGDVKRLAGNTKGVEGHRSHSLDSCSGRPCPRRSPDVLLKNARQHSSMVPRISRRKGRRQSKSPMAVVDPSIEYDCQALKADKHVASVPLSSVPHF